MSVCCVCVCARLQACGPPLNWIFSHGPVVLSPWKSPGLTYPIVHMGKLKLKEVQDVLTEPSGDCLLLVLWNPRGLVGRGLLSEEG